MNEEMKAVSYCVGMSVAGSLMQQNLQSIEPGVMAQAIADVFEGKPAPYSPEQANEIIQKYLSVAVQEQFKANKEIGEKFLADNFKKEGVKTTVSGLQYEIVKEGKGKKPAATSQVKVHYHGTLIDGTVFDSSVERGEAISFPLNGVIKGWTEALQLMPVGSKWKLFIPQELAYGPRGAGGGQIPPYAVLIFEVELLGIEK